jgi:hypothetical protein
MDQWKEKYNSENRLLQFIRQDRHLAEWMHVLTVLLQQRENSTAVRQEEISSCTLDFRTRHAIHEVDRVACKATDTDELSGNSCRNRRSGMVLGQILTVMLFGSQTRILKRSQVLEEYEVQKTVAFFS